MVHWLDSVQPIGAWQWVEDYQIPEVTKCVSVGYLIAETGEAIALAPNIGDVNSDRMQASGIIRIPRCCIQKIVDLAPAA